jgi:rubrerythrin
VVAVRRRAFLRAAGATLAGGSALVVAACGDDEESNPDAGDESVAAADAGVLNGALALENQIVAAYAAGSALLRGEDLKLARRILAQERAHADALTQEVRRLGFKPAASKSAYDFPKLRNAADVMRYADELENQAIAAYIDALPKLTSPGLKGTVAAILTNEAEHLASLALVAGRTSAPDAFVLGQRPSDQRKRR